MNNIEAGLPNITLGWELEATGRARRPLSGIEVGHDGSVSGDGLEYRVKRELVHTPDKSLAALRTLATDPYLQVNRSCGFHVHIGLAKRSRKIHAWAGWFVQLARDLESYAFAAVPESRRANNYCRSWKESRGSIIAQQYSASKGSNQLRYNWVNPVEIFRPGGIRTIEVRLMGDTKRYTYLLAWISVCRLMAISSWALLFDPSRLEFEREELKKSFNLVRDNFLRTDVPSSTVAKTALYLSQKAGLSLPFGRSLEKIGRVERDLVSRAQMADKERKEYDALMKAMRQSVDEHRERVISGSRPPEGIIIPGDTVRCIRVPEDGGLTVGNFYRVVEVQAMGCIVLNDDGLRWHVHYRHLRLAETLRGRVPISAA